jgi:GGDEF domain-containing protein
VADAEGRVRALVRGNDTVVRRGDDGFAAVVTVADEEALSAMCDRIGVALAALPVPIRAARARPEIRAAFGAAVFADVEMAAVLASVRGDRAAAS